MTAIFYHLHHSGFHYLLLNYCKENDKTILTFFRLIVNIFLCISQLGIACVYFVFIGDNLRQVRVLSEVLLTLFAFEIF